jgi:Fur family zinc uptake transcriptional regulator
MTKLSKNQTMVLEQLNKSDTPKTAYELLDDLRDQGMRAPLQIYRALDKLMELDVVHKLESMNAFIACSHDHHEDHDCAFCAFQICDGCAQVQEIHDPEITKKLEVLTAQNGFHIKTTHLEIRGLCQDCQQKL